MMRKMISKIICRIRQNGIFDIFGLALHIGIGLIDFHLNPCAKKQSKLFPPNHEKIKNDLEASGLEVIPFKVNVEDFYSWLKKADFPKKYVNSYAEGFIEKALEHYVGSKLLDLNTDDILIDVGASNSPWFEIAERMYGCKTYALDLTFPKGINERNIGADATAMPLPEGFASKIALHCAYEMFEGNADIDFIAEAKRVLSLGGKVIIIPLYLDNIFHVESAPFTDRRNIDYQGAVRVWRDNWFRSRVRFARIYSTRAFLERVVSNLNGLDLKIYYIQNEIEISTNCYLKFAAVFEK